MKLMIYGAGAKGRELMDSAQWQNRKKHRWDSIEFIDDVRNEKQFYGANLSSLKEVAQRPDKEDMECLAACGEAADREIMFRRLKKAGLKLGRFILDKASLSPDIEVGEGTIILGDTTLCSGCRIGDNVLFQGPCIIGHDSRIGDHSVISSNVYTGGGISVGRRVYIGLSASVKENITIGDDAIVGMGSVVLRNIKGNRIVNGNPARVIGENIEKKVFGR